MEQSIRETNGKIVPVNEMYRLIGKTQVIVSLILSEKHERTLFIELSFEYLQQQILNHPYYHILNMQTRTCLASYSVLCIYLDPKRCFWSNK